MPTLYRSEKANKEALQEYEKDHHTLLVRLRVLERLLKKINKRESEPTVLGDILFVQDRREALTEALGHLDAANTCLVRDYFL
ncbi:hypothetical protein ES705_43723 [subsurface metagenome]